MVEFYLSDAALEKGELAGRMKKLLGLHKQMSDDQLQIESLRERMNDYRARMDELHVQIVSLEVVKSGGSLTRHLKKKMEEISDRVQQATIALVDRQESLMLARIEFMDAVSELSMEPTELAAN
jgi:hypothetical protein